ncbi:MAG: ThiF family adenylyltransferase [Nanoarchaeota archaeon]|nr:ThiF family adenylyltransferase [Nanoarchaeota archaeon]
MKLKINESVYILKESENIYQVIFTATRKIKRFNVDSLVKELIDFLNEEREENKILEKFSEKYNNNKISSCINSLKSEGVIKEYSSFLENERFSKQMLFIDELTNSREETLELQRKIENSNFSVFGIGGIGTWIVNGLYQIGVKNIKIVDPDIVDKTNLNRQLFFNSSDIGKYKVDIIQTKFPDINIIPFKRKISQNNNLEDIIKNANFIVNCADSPSIVETTQIIDKYASKYNIPYCVAGGYNMHLGMIGPIIVPGKTATFQDFIDYQKRMDPLKDFEKIKDIEQTGSLGPIAGAVANIQVMEIFKYLTGKGSCNLNKFAEIDFLNFNIEWRNFK